MDLSLVSLKGGSFLVGRGEKTYSAQPHPSLPSWYTPDFFLTEPLPWHTHETYEVVDALDLKRVSSTREEPYCFQEMFNDITLTKAVAYTHQPIHNFSWESALSFLMERGRNYFIYATDGILGGTPELLFDITSDGIETVALAATALNPEALQNQKEQEEHEIVVKGIQEALLPFGNLTIYPIEDCSFGKLLHLKQKLKLNAQPEFDQLIKALHPTPALGAWPKKPGKAWLEKWEVLRPRRRFGAPFGYSFPERNESRVFVAIRCVQWNTSQAALWAGAGITDKSLFAEEKVEVLQKLSNTAFLMGIC